MAKQWRQNQIAWLQKKRSKILAKYSLEPDCLISRLKPIEKQLSLLQQELVDNLALKAGKFWRENGEISAGFLKRCATRRATQTCIDELEHPVTGTRCSSPTDLQDAAISFYQQLCTPEEIHQSSVDSLLEAVPTTCRIPDSMSGSLVRPFSKVALIDAAKRCPNHSSPGPEYVKDTMQGDSGPGTCPTYEPIMVIDTPEFSGSNGITLMTAARKLSS